PHALWLIMDLTEAALRTGRRADAAAHLAAARETGIAAISPRLALITGGSAAMAAQSGHDRDLVEKAIPIPGATRRPFGPPPLPARRRRPAPPRHAPPPATPPPTRRA